MAALFMAVGIPFAVIGCGSDSGDDGVAADGEGGSGAANTGANNQGGSGGSPINNIEGCDLTTQPLSTGTATVPSVLWTGTDFAIAFIQDGAVRLMVIDPAGAITNDVQVSSGSGAALPSLYLLEEGVIAAVWSEGGNVLARHIDTTAAMITDPMVIDQTTSADPRPSAAPLAEGALALAWMEQPSITLSAVEQGQVVDTVQIDGWFPALAGGAGQTGVAWSDGAEAGPVAFALFDQVGSPSMVPESSALINAATATSSGFAVAWEEDAAEEPRIFMANFDESGGFVSKKQISPGAASANWPALAWTGSDIAVAYYQFREGPPAVVLTLVDPATLSPVEDELVLADNGKYPSVAAGGSSIATAYAVPDGPVELAMLTCEEQ